MTKDAQRIAIATAMGYRRAPEYDYGWTSLGEHGVALMWSKDGTLTDQEKLPDYLNDLNACHVFEEELTWSHEDSRGTCSIYREHLERIVHAKWKSRDTECAAECHEWHATAEQRCEAFLRTLSLWQESSPAAGGKEIL